MRPSGRLPRPGDDTGAAGRIGVPAPVLELLRAGRSRLALLSLVETTTLAALAAAAVYAVAAAARRLLPYADSLPDRSAAFAIAASLFVVGVAIGVWRFLRNPPALIEVARSADRRFGLDELFATVIDLDRGAASGEPDSPVVQALLREAERRARSLRPTPLAPVRAPKPAWLLPVLIAAGYLLTPVPHATPALADERNALLAASRAILNADATDASAGVRAAAVVLSEAARANEDAYLTAIANAIFDLAERLATGELESIDAEMELADLLEHVENASNAGELAQLNSGSPAGPGAEAPSSGQPAESTPGATQDAPAQQPESGNAMAAGETSPGAEPSPDAAARLALEALIEEAERRIAQESENQAMSAAGPAQDAGDAESATSSDSPGTPGTPDNQALASIRMETNPDLSGSPAATPGSEAGTMAQIPFDEEYLAEYYDEYYAELLAELVNPTRMPLSMRSALGVAQVPIELPPETRPTATRDNAVTTSAWRQTDEDPVPTGDIGLAHRDVASRYFQSLIERPEVDPAP